MSAVAGHGKTNCSQLGRLTTWTNRPYNPTLKAQSGYNLISIFLFHPPISFQFFLFPSFLLIQFIPFPFPKLETLLSFLLLLLLLLTLSWIQQQKLQKSGFCCLAPTTFTSTDGSKRRLQFVIKMNQTTYLCFDVKNIISRAGALV